MAEELFFIKTNPNVAKINLYNKLCREEDHVLKFLEPNAKSHLELIRDKVKDSVEELTEEELKHIFSWFATTYPSDFEEVKTQLFINGLDIFYEIPTASHAENFLQILSNYEKLSQQHLDYITDAQRFNQFIIYGLFLTELSGKEQGSQNILCDYLKSDYQPLYTLAENQFSVEDSDGKILPDLQHYFTDLYDLTKFYKGSIIKLEQ
ncbi:hypothetical protein [Chryseobacterium sp. Mn2064]|uniref:hypothetical protein n=1 Tax=Chryseobacterium sp. Mn2064 TaxID=3395263 RepID=UPI003BE3EE33